MLTAAGPVYGGALSKVRHAAQYVQRRAHYRNPKVYRQSVVSVVGLTLVWDAFLMGTTVAQVFQER